MLLYVCSARFTFSIAVGREDAPADVRGRQRFDAWSPAAVCCAAQARGGRLEPQTRFYTSADGTRLAYMELGEGPCLVVVSPWGESAESYWERPEARDYVERCGRDRRLIYMDRRGVEDVGLDAHLADIAALIDHLGLKQVDVWAAYGGAPVAAAFAAQHPERVSRLVLFAMFARGGEVAPPGAGGAMAELIRSNWSLARRAFADVFFPTGPIELQRWVSGHLRDTASPEVAARYIEFQTALNVAEYLPQIQAPTLVLHRRGDRNVPFAAGREAAALIPGARFIALEGDIGLSYFGDISYVDTVLEFLDEGRPQEPAAGTATGAGLVTILFTDMQSSTALTQQLGDAGAQEVRHAHNDIVRAALSANSGSEIKQTGDGGMASFTTASSALECAIAIQRGVSAHREANPDSPLGVYVGLNAGEPIAEDDDLFGTSINLAARICDHAEPGQILASNVVRELAAGKGFLFADQGDVVLRGFEDPVRLYELRWREP